jgi:four helix bundle protein
MRVQVQVEVEAQKSRVFVGLGFDLDLDFSLDFLWRLPVNFRNLEVYRIAIRFLTLATEIAGKSLSRHAALSDQLRRAALSIPLNIAEGSGKNSGPDQRRFYSIARGSAMECAAIMDVCHALNLLDQAQVQEADQHLISVVRILSKMCRP